MNISFYASFMWYMQYCLPRKLKMFAKFHQILDFLLFSFNL